MQEFITCIFIKRCQKVFFFFFPRVDLLRLMMTAARTIAILLVMTIVDVNAKQLPRTRSKRDFVEIPGKALLVSIVGK